jgi:pyruvate dehydrogenase E2 component (dihydrolipoamide acetyltransferase)
MAVEIVMPNLGFDTQSGRLLEWVKQPGERVARGDILAVIESDKANVELESVAAGVLLEHLVAADTDVAVGAVIARVGSPDEIRPTAQTNAPSPTPIASTPVTVPSDVSPIARRLADEHGIDLARVSGSGVGGRIMRGDVEAMLPRPTPAINETYLALPKVRRAARENGIDLRRVPPTGSRGQITMTDFERFRAQAHADPIDPPVATPTHTVTAPPAHQDAPVPDSTPTPQRAVGGREIALSRMRRTIGERLSKSMRDAPHFYVSGEFDIDAAMRKLPVGTRVNDLIQYVTVQTLLRVPELNATYADDQLIQYDHVHLGVAVALDDGLLTPVLRHAERLSLIGIAEESRALIARAREKHLRADDLQGATFTISNLGVIKQVERFTAVINPPQVAILAVGTVKARPVVVDGGLHIRNTVYVTLSGDHRAVDGMHLARFMATFQEQLDLMSR